MPLANREERDEQDRIKSVVLFLCVKRQNACLIAGVKEGLQFLLLIQRDVALTASQEITALKILTRTERKQREIVISCSNKIHSSESIAHVFPARRVAREVLCSVKKCWQFLTRFCVPVQALENRRKHLVHWEYVYFFKMVWLTKIQHLKVTFY